MAPIRTQRKRRLLPGPLPRAGLALLAGWGAYRLLTNRLSPPYSDTALLAGHLLLARRPRTLLLSPAPGQAEPWTAGTLARARELGASLHQLVLWDLKPSPSRLNAPAIGRREQEAVAALLGVGRLAFAGLGPAPEEWEKPAAAPPSGTPASLARQMGRIRKQVLRAIHAVRPDLLLLPDPSGPLRQHGAAFLAAALFPEWPALARGTMAGKAVCLYASSHSNLLVDTTTTAMDKAKALSALHTSLGPAHHPLATRLRDGLQRGKTPCRYTEAYYRLL